MEELAAIFEAIVAVYVIGAVLKFILRFFSLRMAEDGILTSNSDTQA